MLVDRSPKPGVPIAFEAEIALVGKLEHRAMCIGLEVQPERNIEPACANVETPDVFTALFLAHHRIENVIKVEVNVVVFEGPARPALALHIVEHRIKPVPADHAALEIEAGDGRGG